LDPGLAAGAGQAGVAMARPVWFVDLLKKAFPTRFLLARLTRAATFGRLIDRWLFEGDDLIYLPSDKVIRIDQPLDVPGEVVLPSQIVEHFVRQAGYHWIMNTCICRDANRCRDYPIDLGCLFLGKAVLQINPELGRRVTREEALEHVRRARAAGLVHMIGRNKLDTLWLGAGPGDQLLTICNCCPCCCLWRVLPHIAPYISSKVTAMPGVTVRVTGRCTGCGACTNGVCFVQAIQLRDGRATISGACRGCGRCVSVCPQGAIELSVDGGRPAEEAMRRLSSLVDVS
jgi:ferredoxin